MKNVNLSLIKYIDNSYSIYIQTGLLNSISSYISDYLDNKILIITDSNVRKLYGNSLFNSLKKYAKSLYIHSFPYGERHKNINTKMDIERFMFENRFSRDSLIIALGGGVVGDLAGFTASTFNRGIPYIQIPTTIVAQVDSSIGGKTAIDVSYGKNLIGTFFQPKIVLIDPMVLNTLSDKEYISGMAEVIKHAVIKSYDLFTFLEDKRNNILNRDMSILEVLIEMNCSIKKDVVEKDEKESNLRQILNYGHTIGHAIEKVMDYNMLHGECVAIGMVYEAIISNKLGYLDNSSVNRIVNLLDSYNLPIDLPSSIKNYDIYNASLLDKKSLSNEPRYSLPKSIGDMLTIEGSYGVSVDKNVLFEALNTNVNIITK